MIMVDSGVWIDYFRGTPSAQAKKLDTLLGVEPLAIGDLILTEVLQGFTDTKLFKRARTLLGNFDLMILGGEAVAIEAAENFRRLRRLGVTVRKTIDTIIATHCILRGLDLLHNDRDFDPFEKHLGLNVVKCT